MILADSVSTNEDYAKRAVELGHTVLSSCEHGTAGNWHECFELAQKYGLRWRYVAEAYFVKDRLAEDEGGKRDRKNCHLILAARTAKGIGDLNEVLSEANISGYYFRPRVDMELLLRLDPRDVFVTTACVGGVWAYDCVSDKETKEWHYEWHDADALVRQLHAHFGDSFMLEVQPHHTEKQKAVNRHILELYRSEGISLIAGMDSHYIYPEEAELRAMRLEANHITYEDEEGWFMDYPSDEEAYQRFADQGVLSPAQIREALDNTGVFLTFEDVDLDKGKKLPTLYPELTQEERNEKYRQLVASKWEEYKKSVPPERWPEYEAGIQYEVDTITSTNTSDYFLLDYEWIRRAKELGGVLTRTGRGSGPSYFTNTLLGFSSIDRFALPITMYPDRFISADRLKAGSLPDIDMNVADQEIFGQAMADVMGEWRSAPMVAFGTLKRASAWKMYCRANNVPFEIANTLSDRLKEYEADYKHADEDERDDIDVHDYVPKEYWDYLDQSEKYLGMIDSISPHPCAYLICQHDIRREIGIFRLNAKSGKKKTVYAAFIDGATADGFGYLKNDNLKVDVVKVNADIYGRIGMDQPSVPELLDMTRNDAATWDMYAKGYTLGLNQAEKPKSTEKVMRYKPRNISELSAFVAGIRPAFQSMLDKLLGRERFSYNIPALDKLLQTKELPQSFILYQEQMMKVLQYAGFTAPESYAAIKAIAKKHPEKVLPLKEKFLDEFAARLIMEENIAPDKAEETSDKVWTIISDACGYGFNSCVVGSTKIMRSSSNGSRGFSPTIEEMYRIRNDLGFASVTGHMPLHKKYRRCGYGKALSLCADNRIRENQIVDIRYQGKRPVFRLTTASGMTVTCTDNHKFPIGTADHLVMLRDLHVGDKLFALGSYEIHPNTYRFTDGTVPPNYPAKGQSGFQRREDGASVMFKQTRLLKIANRCPCEKCGRPYSDFDSFELHHEDGDRSNNSPDNLIWLCNSCHKKAHYAMGRVKRFEKGIPSFEDEIVSIEPAGQEDVYDVEMAAPDHNFVLDNGLVIGNSHATAVALDSLYTAWAKAHYPYETYVSLLSNYAEKGDKDRIAQAKVEMKKAFGIRIVPCRFRQDNRSYFIDKENKTISDALTSVKFISKGTAAALYDMRNTDFRSFVDLLYSMEMQSAFDTRKVDILIRMGYFEEFGSEGKLLQIFDAFYKGENRFSKAHVKATQEKRLDALRQYEKELPESTLPMPQQMKFEIDHYGVPLSVFPERKGAYAVLEVDDKYSPKVKLYNVASGTVGLMKVRKPLYKKQPLSIGDVIDLLGWQKKPAYQFKDGKPQVRPGVSDLWIQEYKVLPA